MAQQFVLKGVKDIRDYKSTDGTFTFKLKQDPRGGYTFQIPRWYNRKGNNVVYESCTVFDLENTPYLMIIPTSMDTQIQVTFDGNIYDTVFSNFRSVERIIFTDKSSKKIVLEYLLPSISGGAVAKRIVQAEASIGTFTITGKGSVDTGNSSSYQSNATPPDDAVYAWTVIDNSTGNVAVTGKAEVTSGQTSTGCTVSWKTAGSYGVKCEISSVKANDSPQDDTKPVTCSTAKTVGTVTVQGSTTPTAEDPEEYTASVSGANVTLEYQWSVLDGNAIIGTPNADSTDITFEAAGNSTVQCAVSSSETSDSDSDTLSVVVASAKELGVITVEGPATVSAATEVNYQATEDGGNVVDQTYQWTVLPTDGVVIDTPAGAATDITFNTAGNYDVTCTVNSVTATNGQVSNTKGVTATADTEGFTGVTLGGDQTIDTLNSPIAYTSAAQGGAALVGITTYQWTVTDSQGNTDNNGAVIATPTAQNTNITYSTDSESYQVRCKWTNNAYDPSTKTGMRNVDVQT